MQNALTTMWPSIHTDEMSPDFGDMLHYSTELGNQFIKPVDHQYMRDSLYGGAPPYTQTDQQSPHAEFAPVFNDSPLDYYSGIEANGFLHRNHIDDDVAFFSDEPMTKRMKHNPVDSYYSDAYVPHFDDSTQRLMLQEMFDDPNQNAETVAFDLETTAYDNHDFLLNDNMESCFTQSIIPESSPENFDEFQDIQKSSLYLVDDHSVDFIRRNDTEFKSEEPMAKRMKHNPEYYEPEYFDADSISINGLIDEMACDTTLALKNTQNAGTAVTDRENNVIMHENNDFLDDNEAGYLAVSIFMNMRNSPEYPDNKYFQHSQVKPLEILEQSSTGRQKCWSNLPVGDNDVVIDGDASSQRELCIVMNTTAMAATKIDSDVIYVNDSDEKQDREKISSENAPMADEMNHSLESSNEPDDFATDPPSLDKAATPEEASQDASQVASQDASQVALQEDPLNLIMHIPLVKLVNLSKLLLNDSTFARMTPTERFNRITEVYHKTRASKDSLNVLNAFQANQPYKVKDSPESRMLANYYLANKRLPGCDKKCLLCGETFPDIAVLNQHIFTHNVLKILNCRVCELAYPSPADIFTHIRNHHNGTTENDQLYSCLICAAHFKSKYFLNKHMKIAHPAPNKLKCSICDYTANTKQHMAQHSIDAHGPFFYECPVCLKRIRPSSAKSHVKLHNDKRHKCNVCGRLFKTARILKEHWEKHNTSKPIIKCDICDTTFHQLPAYVKHRRLKHDDKWPFYCSLCSWGYFTAESVRLHELKVHRLYKNKQ